MQKLIQQTCMQADDRLHVFFSSPRSRADSRNFVSCQESSEDLTGNSIHRKFATSPSAEQSQGMPVGLIPVGPGLARVHLVPGQFEQLMGFRFDPKDFVLFEVSLEAAPE